MIWTAKQLQEALGVEVNSLMQTGIVQFNSKDIANGQLFIALLGATDGHLYARDAIDRGASGVIVSQTIADIPKEKIILVPDTMVALQQLAAYKRKNSKAKFIGVTGSTGKTSTKEALKIMFEVFGQTFASRGNFNNNIGMPINLASMPDDTEYAIFELGMSAAGEIRELTKVVRPDIAIITNVAAAHLEFFNSVEDIVDAKCEIFEGLSSQGTAVISRDSIYYERMLENIKRTDVENIYTFGESENARGRLKDYSVNSGKTALTYIIGNSTVEVNIPYILPVHQAENFAGCLSIIANMGLDLQKAGSVLSKFTQGDGRGKIINAKHKDKEYQIICDYYNANPDSLKASLKYFKQLEHESKVVIIGDMLELGPLSAKFHEELAPFIVDSGATKIILVGLKVKFINDLLPKKLYIKQFDNVDLLLPELSSILGDNELILIKGSRGIRLNKILEYFS